MKSIYLIFDEIAKENIAYFIANNDKHAEKMLRNDLQKQPQDVEFSVFKICEFNEDELFKPDPIFVYPEKPNNSVKMTNENIDKLMEE